MILRLGSAASMTHSDYTGCSSRRPTSAIGETDKPDIPHADVTRFINAEVASSPSLSHQIGRICREWQSGHRTSAIGS